MSKHSRRLRPTPSVHQSEGEAPEALALSKACVTVKAASVPSQVPAWVDHAFRSRTAPPSGWPMPGADTPADAMARWGLAAWHTYRFEHHAAIAVLIPLLGDYPAFHEAASALANSYAWAKEYRKALDLWERAEELARDDPKKRAVYVACQSSCFLALGNFESAHYHARRAVAFDNESAEILFALWGAEKAIGKPDHGATLARCIEMAPDDTLFRWSAKWNEMTRNDWTAARVHHLAGARVPAAHPFPQWDGTPTKAPVGVFFPSTGFCGFGDFFLLVRLLPWARQRCGGIVLGTTERHDLGKIEGLLRRMMPDIRFIRIEALGNRKAKRAAGFESVIEIDDLLSMAGAEAMEPTAPYLSADPALVKQWRGRLPLKPGVQQIGLCWAAGGADRRMPLAQFSPLLALPNTAFVSLQKGPPAAELASFVGRERVLDFTGCMTDFSQTAAAMACCDRVVSVDTAVANLAGAMFKEVHVPLGMTGEWRWGAEPDRCAYWPTARLYRDATPDGRHATLQRVAVALGAPAQNGAGDRAGRLLGRLRRGLGLGLGAEA